MKKALFRKKKPFTVIREGITMKCETHPDYGDDPKFVSKINDAHQDVFKKILGCKRTQTQLEKIEDGETFDFGHVEVDYHNGI